jgi:hypothetical protein
MLTLCERLAGLVAGGLRAESNDCGGGVAGHGQKSGAGAPAGASSATDLHAGGPAIGRRGVFTQAPHGRGCRLSCSVHLVVETSARAVSAGVLKDFLVPLPLSCHPNPLPIDTPIPHRV